ncbi:hypothetical protein BDZ89DRAFT_989333 [Hymenopellis radicata]|nr:hypothetical protein BDZ89DRAFT_989333 [Hymenopellis radicata]
MKALPRRGHYRCHGTTTTPNSQTRSICAAVTSTTPPAPEFPSIDQCQSYPPGNQHMSFKLVDRFESLDDRLLFTAQTGSTTVLVKFTRSYSPALHTLCHDLGHAPQLLGYQELSGGWFVVVMEFLEGWMHLYLLQLSDSQRFAAWEQIRTLADTFHKAGFVHGDLRTANILAPPGWDSTPTLPKLRVVDYDWGGVCGTARYPTPQLTSELLTRPRHTLDDLIITEEDDFQVLLRTFQILTPDIVME